MGHAYSTVCVCTCLHCGVARLTTTQISQHHGMCCRCRCLPWHIVLETADNHYWLSKLWSPVRVIKCRVAEADFRTREFGQSKTIDFSLCAAPSQILHHLNFRWRSDWMEITILVDSTLERTSWRNYSGGQILIRCWNIPGVGVNTLSECNNMSDRQGWPGIRSDEWPESRSWQGVNMDKLS